MELTLKCTEKLPQNIIDEYDLLEDAWDENDIDYSIEIQTKNLHTLNRREMIEVRKFMNMWDNEYGNKYGSFTSGEAWFDQLIIQTAKI